MGNATHKTQAEAQAHNHPTAQTFVKIGLILFVITAIEFGIVYIQGIRGIVVTVLAVLSVLKFILVGGYFMHLKFDHKFLTWAFAVGVVLATLITIAQKFVNLA